MKKGLSVIALALLMVLTVPGGCKAPAKFEVASLDVMPPEVIAGEAVNVTAEVENTGASEGTYTAVLTVDGAEAQRKDIVVTAGATETVTFSLVQDAPGSYKIGIGGLSSTLIVEGLAKIEISFNPNPVPCKDEHWHWRVILTEVNGIGVKLNNVTMEIYRGERLLDKRDYDSSSIEEWLGSAYLPAYGSADFGAGFPCQAISHEIVTITGVDDKDHKMIATGRVDFLPQVELKYDDGKPDSTMAIGRVPGRGYLVQFSPPSKPFTISSVTIFGSLYGTGYENRTFTIQVWDKDLNEIYSASHPHTKFSLSQGWVEVEIPAVAVDGNFYIHVCTQTPREGGIQICYDSSLKNEHSEVTQNWEIADWYLGIPKEKVNWMIRVVGVMSQNS